MSDVGAPRVRILVGIGSNLGDPIANVRAAVKGLEDFIDIRRVSSLYRTEPVGVKDQPPFVNCALAGDTDLTPGELVRRFQAIEDGLGRRRDVPMGPRTIDLDLLLYGDWRVKERDAVVPHPRMHERRFVLGPLAEIAPRAEHPALHKTVARLLEELPEGDWIEHLDVEGWPP